MRRIIASVNTTLDGYMEGPGGEGDLGWLMPFVPDGIADNARLLGEETDAILLGRGTYHGFAGFWPTQEGEFADLMNLPPKYVFASEGALSQTPWGAYGNAHLVDRDVEARVRAMKAEDGRDMVILASGGLVSSFLGLGLVDELRIAVCPVVLGAGKRYLRGLDRIGRARAGRLEALPERLGAPDPPRDVVRRAHRETRPGSGRRWSPVSWW